MVTIERGGLAMTCNCGDSSELARLRQEVEDNEETIKYLNDSLAGSTEELKEVYTEVERLKEELEGAKEFRASVRNDWPGWEDTGRESCWSQVHRYVGQLRQRAEAAERLLSHCQDESLEIIKLRKVMEAA